MIDNLRRTLTAPLAILALIAGWIIAVSGGIDLDGIHPGDDGASIDHSGDRSHSPAPCWRNDGQPHAGARRRFPPVAGAVGTGHHLPRASGLAHGRCDHPHAVPAVRLAPEHAGMGTRRPGRSGPQPRPCRVLPRNGRSTGDCCSCRWTVGDRGTRRMAAGLAVRALVVRFARRCAARQPCTKARRASACGERRCAGAAADRTADMALLRKLRDAGRQHAAARQFPGSAGADSGAPHVAHQHRALSSVGGERARLRLDRKARSRRPAGSDTSLR